jgi:hypothetical protein
MAPQAMQLLVLMNSEEAHGTVYKVVVRGEVGDQFGVLFPGVTLSRAHGTTVLTGTFADQAHLVGIIDRAQELGLELISLGPVEDPRTRLQESG